MDWFTGGVDDTDPVFARFSGALHPEFSMIVPSGETLDQQAVVASIRAAHASAEDTFTIEIQNILDRAVEDDGVLMTYDEWQFDGDQVRNHRVSTAYLVRVPSAPRGIQWRHLHETFRSD